VASGQAYQTSFRPLHQRRKSHPPIPDRPVSPYHGPLLRPGHRPRPANCMGTKRFTVVL